jgi:ornithine carbamoyltransferase
MKHLLSIKDLSEVEINSIFKNTDRLMMERKPILQNKTLAMIFEKPSTRTRLSFEVAMTQLGGHAIYFSPRDSQISRGETISDTMKVLSRYVDGVVARLFEHNLLLGMANNSSVPIINGLTDLLHPCQALTDFYTIKQKKKRLAGLKLVFMGAGSNNTCHSLIYGAEKLGVNMIINCPLHYKPKIKHKFEIIGNSRDAVKNADVLYTDVHVSMGQEKEKKRRIRDLASYQLNSEILKLAKKDVIVMHPLPAHRGVEITNKVIDGKNSVVFDQAENRLHVQKAILYLLMK